MNPIDFFTVIYIFMLYIAFEMQCEEISRGAGVVGGRRKSAGSAEDIAHAGEGFEAVGGVLQQVGGNLHAAGFEESHHRGAAEGKVAVFCAFFRSLTGGEVW